MQNSYKRMQHHVFHHLLQVFLKKVNRKIGYDLSIEIFTDFLQAVINRNKSEY